MKRYEYIGGSDIGSILGFNKWRSPLDVYQEKTKQQESKKAILGSPMWLGCVLEKPLVELYEQIKGVKTHSHNKVFTHPKYDFLKATVDAITEDNKLLEIKTTMQYEEWGKSGSDQIPTSYLCQVAWYCEIANIKECEVLVYFTMSREYKIFKYKENKELQEKLIKSAVNFWVNNVQKLIPPDPATMEDILNLHENVTTGKVYNITDDEYMFFQEYEQKAEEIKELSAKVNQLKKDCEELKVKFLSNINDCEIINYADFNIATYKQVNTTRVDTKKLKLDFPQEYDNCLKTTTTRRLKIKKVIL